MLPGGPFDVYDVTGNTYNVFPPLVVKNYYRLRENMKGEANNRERGGWGGMATEYSEQTWPRHQLQGKNPKVHVTL